MTDKTTQFCYDAAQHWEKWGPSNVRACCNQNVPIFKLAGGVFHI